jgi:hypothetical protein
MTKLQQPIFKKLLTVEDIRHGKFKNTFGSSAWRRFSGFSSGTHGFR